MAENERQGWTRRQEGTRSFLAAGNAISGSTAMEPDNQYCHAYARCCSHSNSTGDAGPKASANRNGKRGKRLSHSACGVAQRIRSASHLETAFFKAQESSWQQAAKFRQNRIGRTWNVLPRPARPLLQQDGIAAIMQKFQAGRSRLLPAGSVISENIN